MAAFGFRSSELSTFGADLSLPASPGPDPSFGRPYRPLSHRSAWAYPSRLVMARIPSSGLILGLELTLCVYHSLASLRFVPIPNYWSLRLGLMVPGMSPFDVLLAPLRSKLGSLFGLCSQLTALCARTVSPGPWRHLSNILWHPLIGPFAGLLPFLGWLIYGRRPSR